MFELRDLECFLAVVEHKTFHGAAKALNIAQPPLSRRIARLERDVGAELFSRRSRQVQLTEVGVLFVREARAVLEQARWAQRVARDSGEGRVGHVRLGYVGSSGYSIVPRALRSFRDACPRATVSVEAILGHRQLEALQTGSVDVALYRGTVDAGFRVHRLRTDRFVVALPEAHRFAARRRVALADLAAERFVALSARRAGGSPDLVRVMCARAGFVPDVVQEADTLSLLVGCVAVGIGVAIVGENVRAVPLHGVAYRELTPAAPKVELSALTAPHNTNALVPILLEHLISAAKSAY